MLLAAWSQSEPRQYGSRTSSVTRNWGIRVDDVKNDLFTRYSNHAGRVETHKTRRSTACLLPGTGYPVWYRCRQTSSKQEMAHPEELSSNLTLTIKMFSTEISSLSLMFGEYHRYSSSTAQRVVVRPNTPSRPRRRDPTVAIPPSRPYQRHMPFPTLLLSVCNRKRWPPACSAVRSRSPFRVVNRCASSMAPRPYPGTPADPTVATPPAPLVVPHAVTVTAATPSNDH